MSDLSVYHLLWYFAVYSFLGWCLEVCFCSINTGKFVNRGFLNGPLCPIYGFGMVAVLLVLTPVADNLVVLFLGGMVLASLLELLGGWALKKLFHASWWDYSDQPFNLGGYICLKFSLAWGLCIVAVMRVIHPAVAAFVRMVTTAGGGYVGGGLIVILGVCFVCDLAVTVNTVTKLDRDLGAIDDVAKLLHAGSDAISETLGTTALAVDENVDESMPALRARLDLLRAEIVDERHFIAMRLLRAFPDMKHLRHAEAFEQAKAWLAEKHGQ